MQITIPELSLVVLAGTSGAGKTTFAKQHFLDTEIVSSDACRALVDDDENSMDANEDAFDLVHYIIRKRLKRGKLTVVDATNVRKEDRAALVRLAQEFHVFPVLILLNMPLRLTQDRNEQRTDRDLKPHVLRNQQQHLKRGLKGLKREGFKFLYEFKRPEVLESVEVVRQKLWNNKKEDHGPFDIIGDVHGCSTELKELLQTLGYKVTKHKDRDNNWGYTVKPPKGRKALFLGDLCDRGPASNEVFRIVMSMVDQDNALCVMGNHDAKLLRKLNGKQVALKHGLEDTVAQLKDEPAHFIEALRQFLDKRLSHYVLDEGRLVVAHAGLREEMHGRGSAAVRSFAMYGESTGEIDEFGLPVRYEWAKEYKGKAMVVYGHTPVPDAEWLNNTIDIDTGCVFGGRLTALRYPERELVSIAAKQVYKPSKRPLIAAPQYDLSAQQEYDDLLHIEDVSGKRLIHTRLRPNILIREEHAIAALEVMSRFAINPKWLVYLPPTMSPCETSDRPEFLEYPTEAFGYYSKMGIDKVICEEKHMGSRAVVVVAQSEEVVKETFGVVGEGIGTIYTRTGRAFFQDKVLEQSLLVALRDAMDASGFWETHHTTWAVLDTELMPWSAKAKGLLLEQYAPIRAAAEMALPEVVQAVEAAQTRGVAIEGLLEQTEARQEAIQQYAKAYQQYCWPVNGLSGYQLAPFHLLATEGNTHLAKDHVWHMEQIKTICAANTDLLLATPYRVVDLDSHSQQEEAIQWWLDLTASGGEGMVVKPIDFIMNGKKGTVQPAIKCRGKEYLRIIYGPDYDLPENLALLKKRSLSSKQGLAMKEFALGVEALERFVGKSPLRKVHECVFGVLAMESEPVDPRL